MHKYAEQQIDVSLSPFLSLSKKINKIKGIKSEPNVTNTPQIWKLPENLYETIIHTLGNTNAFIKRKAE